MLASTHCYNDVKVAKVTGTPDRIEQDMVLVNLIPGSSVIQDGGILPIMLIDFEPELGDGSGGVDWRIEVVFLRRQAQSFGQYRRRIICTDE